jgi:hypothetical protein
MVSVYRMTDQTQEQRISLLLPLSFLFVVELSKSKAEDTAKDRSLRAQFGPTEY